MARLDKASPDTLSLDLANPRIPDAKFTDEEAAIAYLYAQADLGELIQSIGNSGWLDFEENESTDGAAADLSATETRVPATR